MRLLKSSFIAALACGAAIPALAADCPGNPDALGTARTIVVDPLAHPFVGSMQYRETIPLRDHEIVLTFDDGPIPPYSDQVLKVLAEQCVKATFFMVGGMAKYHPDGVRRAFEAGHSIGTHSQNHPETFSRMSMERIAKEVDGGIASVSAALGDDAGQLTPFFRIPGLSDGATAEHYLSGKGLMTWSIDFNADDWTRISPERETDLAIKRIEERGRGVLLLHDIHERTVLALPMILRALKTRGYQIVHVVPATASLPATPFDIGEWLSNPKSKLPVVASRQWPAVPSEFKYLDEGGVSTIAISTTGSFDDHGVIVWKFAEPHAAVYRYPWPRQLDFSYRVTEGATDLPCPDSTLYRLDGVESAFPRRDAKPVVVTFETTNPPALR